MYAYIKGTISEIHPSYVVVENGDIGYHLVVSNPYRFNLKSQVTVYTHFHIREDAHILYGFLSKEERELFIRLIGVNGIGPKSALSILATGEISGIVSAIESQNVKYLTKFPGIGPKSAQQIILDLKGKINLEDHVLLPEETQEVLEALIALGYSRKEAEKVTAKVDSTLSTNDQVKQALQLMLK